MFGGVFVKQEYVIGHYHAVTQDEQHVMIGRVILGTEVKETLERLCDARLIVIITVWWEWRIATTREDYAADLPKPL